MQILNQSKDMIIKDYVTLNYDNIPEHCILCTVSKENYYTELGILLGKYESKERCLEIIHQMFIAINRGTKCFEMPFE